MSCTEFNIKAKDSIIDMYIPLLDANGKLIDNNLMSGRVRFLKQNGTIVYVDINTVIDGVLSAEITSNGLLRCVIPTEFQSVGELEVSIESSFKSQITAGASIDVDGYRSNTIKLINFYE